MSKSKHTPGPWFNDAGCFFAEVQLNANRLTSERPIAEMSGGRDDDYEANARLISAAPELLGVLEELLENPAFDVAIGGNPVMVQALMERCKAVIDKARGT